MYRLLPILIILLTTQLTYADFRAISPVPLAEIEQNDIKSLSFQNGCARPDLSDSNVDGTAVFEIAFDREGKPFDGKIISSNGSDSDNSKIIHAFSKQCKYTRNELTLPPGVTKEFTYSWKAHQDTSGLRGCIMKVEYPTASQRLNEQGSVETSFRYLPNDTYESKISQSSGFQRLDDATLKSINRCLENHALKADPNLNNWNSVRMSWKLTGSTDSSTSSSHTSQNNKE